MHTPWCGLSAIFSHAYDQGTTDEHVHVCADPSRPRPDFQAQTDTATAIHRGVEIFEECAAISSVYGVLPIRSGRQFVCLQPIVPVHGQMERFPVGLRWWRCCIL